MRTLAIILGFFVSITFDNCFSLEIQRELINNPIDDRSTPTVNVDHLVSVPVTTTPSVEGPTGADAANFLRNGITSSTTSAAGNNGGPVGGITNNATIQNLNVNTSKTSTLVDVQIESLAKQLANQEALLFEDESSEALGKNGNTLNSTGKEICNDADKTVSCNFKNNIEIDSNVPGFDSTSTSNCSNITDNTGAVIYEAKFDGQNCVYSKLVESETNSISQNDFTDGDLNAIASKISNTTSETTHK